MSDNDEAEYVPIPLDRASIARLAELERDLGRPATKIAGQILGDLLKQGLKPGRKPPTLN